MRTVGGEVTPADRPVDALVSMAVQHGVAKSERGLRSYLDHLFSGCPIAGRRVLDVGAGTGFAGLYCLARGASTLVALEPEAAGSTSGAAGALDAMAARLGVSDQVRVVPRTFQDYEASPGSFDLVILQNSVNHLDEPACVALLDSDEARVRYQALFAKLFGLSAPGADVLITDASRRNFFALLRLRSPFARTVQWHLHQTPETWSALLADCGFEPGPVRWSSPGRSGNVGRLVLANRAAAYFLHSQFILRCRRPGAPPEM